MWRICEQMKLARGRGADRAPRCSGQQIGETRRARVRSIGPHGWLAIDVTNDAQCKHAGNPARGVDLFTRKVSCDRIPQQLYPATLDAAEREQRGCHSILLGNDALALHLALAPVSARQAREFGFTQVEPDLHSVRPRGVMARGMRREA